MNYPVCLQLSRSVNRSLCTLALAALASVSTGSLFAQATAAAPAAADESASSVFNLDTVVVTGSSVPKTRLESAAAIMTLDPLQIAVAAPRSASEMFKLIPGLYTESSGGEVGNNIVVRGVATNGGVGGYLYVAIQEDGLPVISESNFRFTQADAFTRVTNFVERVEALKG